MDVVPGCLLGVGKERPTGGQKSSCMSTMTSAGLNDILMFTCDMKLDCWLRLRQCGGREAEWKMIGNCS
jgi:hypothetical protein